MYEIETADVVLRLPREIIDHQCLMDVVEAFDSQEISNEYPEIKYNNYLQEERGQ